MTLCIGVVKGERGTEQQARGGQEQQARGWMCERRPKHGRPSTTGVVLVALPEELSKSYIKTNNECKSAIQHVAGAFSHMWEKSNLGCEQHQETLRIAGNVDELTRDGTGVGEGCVLIRVMVGAGLSELGYT
ncbi:hypothetical protein E2C01_032052 [Portunus trituberculatus]|uniref:Uncharacterized protein n=1 Tax=Portunus trituberculatus TaxID=210409 RepID=A0A5B7F1S2_PORTR|nr:hypothetical protein [Portunus trituberculatus]